MAALDMDPRHDLRWIEDELQKPMSERQRDALLEARRRTLAAIEAEKAGGFACDPCECGGRGCPVFKNRHVDDPLFDDWFHLIPDDTDWSEQEIEKTLADINSLEANA